MMREWKEYFIEWSKTREFKSKMREAKKVIDNTLKGCNRAYIAYSGGKDSTAMMHLILSHNKFVTVVHWDYGRHFVPQEIEDEIIENAKKIGVKNFIVLTSSYYEKLGRDAKGILGKHFLGIEVPKLISKSYDVAFIGLRAEEGVKRKLRTKDFIEKDERSITNVFPIKNWSWRDVWAYIVSNNVPYLSLYDKYAPLLGYDKVRFVTLFDPEFDVYGSSNIDKFLMWRFYYEGSCRL